MKFIRFIKQNKHWLLLMYFPVHSLWYELLRIINADNESVLIIHTRFDDLIPFCEWFIIPYCLWYFYIAFMLIYSLKKGRREFFRTGLMVIAANILPMIFCTVVPNGIPASFRPDIAALGRENIALKLVELIYLADSPPLSVMPSMHVSVALTLFFAVMRSESLKGKYIKKAVSGILSLLIVLSTMFIKQHSVLDVIAGTVVALVILAADILIEKRFAKKQ